MNYKVNVELIATYNFDVKGKTKKEAIEKAEELTEKELEKHGVMEYSLEGMVV